VRVSPDAAGSASAPGAATLLRVLFFIDETWQTINGSKIGALGAVAIPQDRDNAFCTAIYGMKSKVLGANELMRSELKGQSCFAKAAFTQDAGEPASLLGDGQMPPSSELGLHLAQLGARPLGVGDALQLEPPRFPGLRANVREAEEGERLRLAKTPRLPVPGGEPSELDQPRLLGIQLQGELRQPSAKLRLEPLGVIPVLKAHHAVVRKTRDDHVTMRVLASPLVSPQVKDVVQVDVR
jgi:hypothetical protein